MRRAFARARAGAPPARLWPALLTIVVGVVLAVYDGGYAKGDWPFAALFLLAVLTLSCRLDPIPRHTGSRPAWWAIWSLVGFCGWSALSALWAAVPAIAWEGALRTLLYVFAFALVAVRPWPPRALIVALALVAGGIVAVALGVLVAGAGDDPSSQFVGGRLGAPVGYANADAALWLLGLWPALALTCRRTLAWPWRAAGLGACCLLTEMALLAQSRGSLVAFAAAAVVALIGTRDRWRVALVLAAVVGDVALAGGALTRVRDASSVAGLASALHDARAAIAWTCALAIVAGATAILAVRRVRPLSGGAERWQPRADRALAALACAAIVAGLVAIGDPIAWTQARWTDFPHRRLQPGRERRVALRGVARLRAL